MIVNVVPLLMTVNDIPLLTIVKDVSSNRLETIKPTQNGINK